MTATGGFIIGFPDDSHRRIHHCLAIWNHAVIILAIEMRYLSRSSHRWQHMRRLHSHCRFYKLGAASAGEPRHRQLSRHLQRHLFLHLSVNNFTKMNKELLDERVRPIVIIFTGMVVRCCLAAIIILDTCLYDSLYAFYSSLLLKELPALTSFFLRSL